MIFRLNEDVLRQALALEIDARMNMVLSADIPPHIFSKKFDRRMRRLQKRAERSSSFDMAIQTGKKAVIILLAAAVASGTTALSVGAIREKLFEYIEEKYTEYSNVLYKSTQPESIVNSEDKAFSPRVPSYIPEGYELIEGNYDWMLDLYYRNANGTYIRYSQMQFKDVQLNFNTEGVEMELIEFKGSKAYYYVSNGNHTLLWDDEKYTYFVASNSDKKTVFRVAESVRNKK